MSGAATGGGQSLERPHVFSPATGPGGPPLLLLHGTGGDEQDLLPLGPILAPGAALLSPRGSVAENGTPRFLRRLREGVFDEADLSLRADELAAFVVAASEHYALPARSLVAVGFSNGANIASALILRHPDLLRGTVLLSAMIPYADPPEAALDGLPVVVSNGTRDPTINHAMTKRLETQLRDRGASVTDLPRPGGHQLDMGVLTRTAGLLHDLG